MRRTMGDVYRNLFHKRFQFRPVNGSNNLSGGDCGVRPAEGKPAEIAAEAASKAPLQPAQPSPKQREMDFTLLFDSEHEARAIDSARRQQ